MAQDNDHNITAAPLGFCFTAVKRRWRVKGKCDANDGHWYCITCKEGFRNQFEKDCHISSGKHVLTWWCRFHDEPEVP